MMRDKTISALVALAVCPGEKDEQSDICSKCTYAADGSVCAKMLRRENMLTLQEYLAESETKKRFRKSDPDLYSRVTDILCDIGIPANLKGYDCLREAILMAVNNNHLIGAITKELYPGVAKKLGTTDNQVERAIRHAIEAAWERSDIKVLQKWFGPRTNRNNSKPTNSEFIALIADKLRWEFGLGRSVR